MRTKFNGEFNEREVRKALIMKVASVVDQLNELHAVELKSKGKEPMPYPVISPGWILQGD